MNKGKDQPKIKDIELTRTEIEEKISSSQSEVKIRKYKRGKLLGRGGFARCYEFTCLDNNKVFAAKVINKQNLLSSRQKQKLITEIKIHKSVHHDQVVAFEHNFEDNENVYILLEVCKNQTLNELFKRRKKLTEIEVQCYIIQLVKGLQYLHSHKIIHRDLKLGNLFLTDKMQLKIGDFGLATKLDYDGEKKKTLCGTPNYIAPEVIDGGAGGGHSYEVDIWAIGIIIYIFIVGKPPFETNDLKQTYKRIKSTQFEFPEDAHISTAAKNLIKRLLVRDPKKRPSLNDILMDDFFNMGALIPKLMPSASMACPPTLDYIRKFMPNADENGICHLHDKKEKNLEEKKISEEKKEENATNETSNNDENKVNEENDNKEKEKEKEQEKLKGAETYVTKWVDYSSKYGLGYLLNNGNIGVYFNDYTKILLNPTSNDFSYVERKTNDEKDMIISFKLNGEPKEIKKKMLIFKHFKNYFDEEIKFEKEEKEKEEKEEPKLRMCKSSRNKKPKKVEKASHKEQNLTPKEGDNVFVRKWMKTKHAIIFRLSNKTSEMSVFKIEDALNSSNFEMNKRIKYTQSILTKMVNSNQVKS